MNELKTQSPKAGNQSWKKLSGESLSNDWQVVRFGSIASWGLRILELGRG